MLESERRVADVLDDLRIAWEYEPTLIIFHYDDEGHVKSGFRPDFYLPKYNFYIEVTKARTLTDKNRKIRKARELHGIRIELLDRYDLAGDLKGIVLKLLQSVKDTPQVSPWDTEKNALALTFVRRELTQPAN